MKLKMLSKANPGSGLGAHPGATGSSADQEGSKNGPVDFHPNPDADKLNKIVKFIVAMKGGEDGGIRQLAFDSEETMELMRKICGEKFINGISDVKKYLGDDVFSLLVKGRLSEALAAAKGRLNKIT